MVTWLAPGTEAGQRRPVGQRSFGLPGGVLDLHAEELDRAGRPTGLRPVRDLDLGAHRPGAACADAPRRESPMPDSGSPVVPHDGGRNVAEPSASNAGQRPVSRRQALAYGSSLAAALPPHPPRPPRPRHRRRPPAQAKRIVAAAERRARQIGVSMFIVVVDDCGVIKLSSRMDGNSQASVTVVPPKAVPANAFRTPPPRWPRGRRSDPARLDRRSRL